MNNYIFELHKKASNRKTKIKSQVLFCTYKEICVRIRNSTGNRIETWMYTWNKMMLSSECVITIVGMTLHLFLNNNSSAHKYIINWSESSVVVEIQFNNNCARSVNFQYECVFKMNFPFLFIYKTQFYSLYIMRWMHKWKVQYTIAYPCKRK